MRAFLFKPKRRVGGRLRVSREWHMRWKLDGQGKYKSRSLGVRDRQVAEHRLREFVRECEREAAGLVVPKLLREAAGKLLSEHLTDFLADLRARRRSAKYVLTAGYRIEKLLADCGWRYAKDVTPDSFLAWRAVQCKSSKTLNDFLDVASALFAWMQRCGRLVANPLAGVGKVETAGKAVRVRRSFTVDELERLRGKAGCRWPLYLTAVLTGLRRNELRLLTWGDVHLDAVKPFVRVRASTTKNGKAATIWLRDDLADELRGCRPADAVEGDPVFPDLPRAGLEWFKDDLAAARIPFVVDGRRADFHSLRHTLATMLAGSNVAPRVAMEVMRHSDMRLTMGAYTDASLLPTVGAVDQLPRFELPQVLAATGTDDQPIGAKHDTQKDTQKLVQACQKLSGSVLGVHGGDGRELSKNLRKTADLSASVNSCHDPKLVRHVGLEPTENRGWRYRQGGTTHKNTHNPSDLELERVVSSWPRLSPELRAAVLSIVKVAELKD